MKCLNMLYLCICESLEISNDDEYYESTSCYRQQKCQKATEKKRSELDWASITPYG